MCGLFGWSYRKADDFLMEKAVVSAMLVDNMASRGKDSWGWHCPVTSEGDKQVGNARETLDASRLARHQVMIGHTRHATTGGVTRKNAHPFRFKTIVGAHNGIVGNHCDLNRKYNRKCKVDSMHLFRHWEEGLDIKEVEAYGAVTFAEHGDSVVNIAYFNSGEMCILDVSKCGKEIGLFWASTKSACVEAARLAGLDFRIYTIQEDQLYAAYEGQLVETGKKFSPSPMTSFRAWDDDLWERSKRNHSYTIYNTTSQSGASQYKKDSLIIGGSSTGSGASSLVELPSGTGTIRKKLESEWAEHTRKGIIEDYKEMIWKKYGYQLPSVRLIAEQELREEGLHDEEVLQILRELDDEIEYTDEDLRRCGMQCRNNDIAY